MRALLARSGVKAGTGICVLCFLFVGASASAAGFRTFLLAFPGHEAAWHAGEGLPENNGPKHALHLARTDPTRAPEGFAGAVIEGAEGITLTELGFHFKNGEHCTLTSPRILVRTEPAGDRYQFGCVGGIHVPAPENMLNWTRVRFTDADAVPVEGTTTLWPGFNNVVVRSLVIIFDESSQEGGPGVVHLDNIDINGILIGKPGNNG